MIKRYIKNKIENYTIRRDLTTGSLSKSIWYLAIPMIFGNMLEVAFNLIDMFWVGRLGHVALASVAMGGTIMMILITMIVGVNTGTLALVSRFVGAKDQDGADNIAMQSLILGFLVAAFIGFVGYVFTPSMLKLLGASPEVIARGSEYLRVIFAGIAFMFFLFTVSAILRGAGDSVTPTVILIIAGVINVILDPLLIFGIGFPRMGVTGAALATVIAFIIGGVIGLEVLLRGRSHIHIKLESFKVDWGSIFRIVKIGVPSSAQMTMRGFMGAVLMAIVASFGTFAVAAYGVGMRLTMVVMMPGFAFAMAAATMVGQNLGAGSPERSQKSAWLSAAYYFIYMVICAALFFIFAPQLIGLFNKGIKVIEIGTVYLRIAAWSFLFIPFGLVLGRALMGAGDTVPPMLITLISLWFFQIPAAYILAKPLGFGLLGVWLAILSASILQAALTSFWFGLGRWKRKKV